MVQNNNYPAAFTFTYTKRVLQLITKVKIVANGKEIEVQALWDTGAMGSCISEQVVTTLNLPAVGFKLIQTPSGKSATTQHLISVILPNNIGIRNLPVCSSKIGEQTVKVSDNNNIKDVSLGMLIGMDIISQGDFAVSYSSGRTVFSFRAPSYSTIDFVQIGKNMMPIRNAEKTKPNELCPCGSGKKYKNCCGKYK